MPIKGNIRKHVIRKIKDMKCGESGFMDIDALSITREGDKYRVFLNLREFFSLEEDVQYHIPITKIGQGESDYEVDIRKSESHIPIDDRPFFEMIDEGEEYKLEYVELHYRDKSKKGKTGDYNPRRRKLEKLEEKLQKAISEENYELAATLRDKLNARRCKNKC